MKTATQDYIDKETAAQRKPTEIYHIWVGSTHWYYTNGDVSIDYDGNTYAPAAIQRGSVSYDSQLEVSKMEIQSGRILTPFVEFVAQNPIDLAWVEVGRLFRDQAPYEKSIIFLGQVKSVAIKGVEVQAECVGFEYFLKMPVPAFRYLPQCNWALFDARCTLSAASYKVSLTSVTVSADLLEITHATIDTYDDGYFNFGRLVFEGQERMIVDHIGDTITLRYKILDIETGDNVDLYPGCDLDVDTCYSKYSNIANFGGFPHIPLDNPATWIT